MSIATYDLFHSKSNLIQEFVYCTFGVQYTNQKNKIAKKSIKIKKVKIKNIQPDPHVELRRISEMKQMSPMPAKKGLQVTDLFQSMARCCNFCYDNLNHFYIHSDSFSTPDVQNFPIKV